MAISLQELASEINPLEKTVVEPSLEPSLQSIEEELDISDYYSKKFQAIANAPSETIERTKNLFDTGHPILGTLSALEYPFSNIFEAVNQFIGEPLARQGKAIEQLSGLSDLYSAPSADSINAAVEIFGPSGLGRVGVKAGLLDKEGIAFKSLKEKIKIPKAENLSSVERDIETRFSDKIKSDVDAAVDWYNTNHGNVINVDDIREYSDDYSKSFNSRGILSEAVHEPASWLGKEIFKRKLADPINKNDVIIMAGGTGAGKTKSIANLPSIQQKLINDASIVYDSNLDNIKTATTRIGQVIDSGRNATVVYIYRDPVEAFVNGMLPRANKEGRTVPLINHASTHLGSQKTVKELTTLYKNNPKVNFIIINNSKGKGQAEISTIDELPKVKYTSEELEKKLYDELNKERSAGKISEFTYFGSLGKYVRSKSDDFSEDLAKRRMELFTERIDSEKLESQRNAGRSGQSLESKKDLIPTLQDMVQNPALYGEFIKKVTPISDDVLDIATGKIYDMGIIYKSPNHRNVFKQVTKDVVDFLYRGSVDYIDELAEYSLTAKNLRNLIKTPAVVQTLHGSDYMEATRLQKGRFELRLSDILQDKRNNIHYVSGKLPDELNEQVVTALRVGRPGNNPNVERLSGQLKVFLRDIEKYAKDSGLDVETPNFPRRYKIKDDESLIPAFIDLLESYGKSNEHINDVIYNIQNNNGFPLIGRTLDDIPDIELAPFLENNIAKNLYNYINTTVNTAEFSKMFGNTNDITLTKKIIRKEALQNKYPVTSKQLDKEIDRIDDLLKAFKSQYHPINSEVWQSVNHNAATFQYLRTLNYSTLSNLSEGFLNVYHSGLGNTLYTALVPGIDHILHQSIRSVVKDFPKAKITRELEELAGVIEQHGTDILKEMFNTEGRAGDIAFKVTGLAQLTNFNKAITAKLGQRKIEKGIASLAKNIQKNLSYYSTRQGKKTIDDLMQLGIDGPKLVKGLLQKGNLEDYKDQINLGKLRYMDQIIFNPQPGNRPLRRFSDPHFKTVSQLGSFPILFGNTVFPRIRADIIKKFKNDPRQATINALKAAEAVAIMSGVTYLAMNIKGIGKNGYEEWQKMQKDKTNKEKLFDAVNGAGWTGQFSPITGMALATKYGEHPFSAIAGPTFDWGFDIVKAGFKGYEQESLDPLVAPIVKSIPVLSSTPQLSKPIIEKIKEKIP